MRSRNIVRAKYGNKPDAPDPIVQTFSRKCAALGLFGEKHIPPQYLRSSCAQRMALMQGLMDTDGHITKGGRCEFVTTKERLANGFSELLASIDVKHTVKEIAPQTKHKGKRVMGAPAWRFSFMVYENKPVFRLPRKVDRMASRDGRRTTESERRRIVDIKPVDSVPVRCIQVDSVSHLFLAGREMIPTHNTEIINRLTPVRSTAGPRPAGRARCTGTRPAHRRPA